jgi:Ca-activated chloride channel family protein
MLRTSNERRATTLGVAPLVAAVVSAALLVAACGGGAAPATPTAAPVTPTAVTAAPTGTPAPTAAPAATNISTGEPSVKGPAAVQPGATFDVEWTGPNDDKDYVTIVAAGATKWTNEPYFYTRTGASPGKLTAPSTPGAYEIWYVAGKDDAVLAKTPITVSDFVGTLDGPDTAAGGTVFEVAWTGPDGQGDYITILKAGAAKWTNEPYFYTATGPKGTLQAPLEAGAYEIAYVSGVGGKIQLRVAITVTPYSASVDGPGSVEHGTTVTIAWTGPNGPGDYITIAAAGAPESSYTTYCYTNQPSPCIINAPAQSGPYEVRYVTQASKVLASEPLLVK